MQSSITPQIANLGGHASSHLAISVCIASYNGERFITDQIKSILDQLSAEDEIIVVDDASTDSTCDRVLAFRDERIHIVRHEKNEWVLHTFEDAIRLASKPLIFLSDQDDLWAANKVQTVVEKFMADPKLMLVASDSALIDENGALLEPSYFAPRGGFSSGFWSNLLRNRYGGCLLAFRAEFRREILPFPHKYKVLHDMWIGLRCAWTKSRVVYIDQPLVLNRRHGTTTTGRKPHTLAQKLRIRWDLLRALLSFSSDKP